MSLKEQTFSAVRWTAVSMVSKLLLRLAQLAILARLLDPEDYGLMAIVTVVQGFGLLFSDLGLNSAYVQRQGVTENERSSLFWLNLAMSGGLMGLVIVASPLLAWFFNDTRLTPLLMLNATTFVFVALGQQLLMDAEKTLDFRPVAIAEIASGLVGFATAVVAAVGGLGVYALVIAGMATTLSSSLLAWILISRGWRPRWRFRVDDVRPYLGFGGALVASVLVNQLISNMDLLLGGRLLATADLGLYSIPRQVVLQLQFLINGVVTRVGFPLIAQVQNDLQRVRSIYLKTLNMVASINAPLYLGMAFFAPEIVELLLGAGWSASAEFLRILALWGFLRSTVNPVGSMLLGMGRADLILKWNLVLLVAIPPVLWLGSTWGAGGLTWAMLALSTLVFIPAWRVLVQPICHARLKEYVLAALRPLVLALLAVIPAYLVASWFGNSLLRLLLGVSVSAPLYLVISFKANHDWFAAMVALVRRAVTRDEPRSS